MPGASIQFQRSLCTLPNQELVALTVALPRKTAHATSLVLHILS